MDPTFEAFLQSWPLDPWVVVPLLLTAIVYARGWLQLRRRGAQRFGPAQLYAFLGGLAALFLALASPIDPFADLLLQVHMLQHLLLMMVAPPLLWLGLPLVPLLRGLPPAVRTYWIVPFLQVPLLRACLHCLTQPAVAWVLFFVATWFWHIPQFYEIALASPGWHYLEHLCFLTSGLLFWYPVVSPFPSRPQWSRWLLLPYLFLADLQNTALSALLTFSDRVLYPHYADVPRLWGISALDDQAIAGALMWVPGSLVYLVPLVYIGHGLLYGARRRNAAVQQPSTMGTLSKGLAGNRIALPLIAASPRRPVPASSSWDLLRVPLIGHFLKSRHARLALQVPMVLLAAAIILDGWYGPQVAPLNLAGVLPWIHWRGLVVLGLLVAGNIFCMACPFLVPRALARKLVPANHPWPRWLRSKWLAAGLLVLFFWAYEVFALWDSPWWTAWIAVGYFVAAFAIDAWFRGAAFCKYVCPIGQFNFVQSLVSPLEVKVRNPVVCHTCTTKDCIRGRDRIPGCELNLFVPRKAGNLDCTFCLDCIHACPHDNIGITATVPGATLWHDRQRSGIGRFARRRDLAALVIVLVFGAFANAAGMVAPVIEWQDQLAASLGLASPILIVTMTLAFGLVGLPVLCVGGAAAVSRWWSAVPGRWLDLATRFAYALVPLGCGMWLTHYSFHLLTSYGAAVPAFQRFAIDAGGPFLGTPEWTCSCCVAVASWVLRVELLFLDLGLLLSLYTAYRIALERCPAFPQALKAFAPWGVLILLLFAAGIWIVFQPMEMRGTLAMPG